MRFPILTFKAAFQAVLMRIKTISMKNSGLTYRHSLENRFYTEKTFYWYSFVQGVK